VVEAVQDDAALVAVSDGQVTAVGREVEGAEVPDGRLHRRPIRENCSSVRVHLREGVGEGEEEEKDRCASSSCRARE